MIRLIAIISALLFSITIKANSIIVKNIGEINKANKNAKPGDTIILKNGNWENVTINLDCIGNATQNITFRAETKGNVIISGKSKISLGGDYLVIDGLYFTKGYSGEDAAINFRINKNKLANNCRVTNCVMNDFNNPKRIDENYWVSFYGRKNRVDHCTFLNKKNLGVLMAVILDDEKNRENFHQIDHNYFGVRLPLASNSGEIIRIGVSQQCQYNSNTQVTDNFFEHCDGETEVISVKSCSNVVRNNLFKECQGGIVLRHGNFNTVESNVFLGNYKDGTGGVRIINQGQWVVNNLFYKCRGVDFRSPLSIMNGVPNSPANRYVPVTDAVVINNSFYDCTPISLCEGSDTERSVPPHNVFFERNIFYNDRDSLIYHQFDDISGIHFKNNFVSKRMKQTLTEGFVKTTIGSEKIRNYSIPHLIQNTTSNQKDSLALAGQSRLKAGINKSAGIFNINHLTEIENNAYKNCGAKWFSNPKENMVIKTIMCKDADEVSTAISASNDERLVLNLTGIKYFFTSPIVIHSNITIQSTTSQAINFSSSFSNGVLFEIEGGASLSLSYLNLDLSDLKQDFFITSDISGSSNHSNFKVSTCTFSNLKGNFFEAAKSSVQDSVIITKSRFLNNTGILLNFANEDDKKGYYNVERLRFTNNTVQNQNGVLLAMIRGGNDESTMGPYLIFKDNNINKSEAKSPFITLNGTQRSTITDNLFTDCNKGKTLILFNDAVRANHILSNNLFKNSGEIETDKFVKEMHNGVK